MLFSKTQEYALQALVLLALTPADFRLNRDVAAQLEVPGPYLAKVLKRFAQSGYLESAKGRGGGYRIRKKALDAPVREVATVADGNDPFAGCLLGLSKCSDHAACPIHDKWMPIRTRVAVLLETQTVADLALKARGGRTRLSVPRKAVTKVVAKLALRR
ncbi:MAG: Rrf2 family transcriptional regulator [Gemmatimonadaceae bacterium]|nr:Rrf2 family transcriptional regulator [Gemmatimonadaceae bacterium]